MKATQIYSCIFTLKTTAEKLKQGKINVVQNRESLLPIKGLSACVSLVISFSVEGQLPAAIAYACHTQFLVILPFQT